ncbi:unnamed protein product [Owenia fusiformis]|uniref:Death domain-containing protein n=1 Tax=Owenia fusiformis TaxID=6347 RepID=A0A8S4NCH8_OWEFU|nr:unnamed protein product [Owenia fusiformis]
MNEKDVRVFLIFYHSIGKMIYFDDESINNIVILDPQWLINVFKSIITVPRFDRKNNEEINLDFLTELEERGILKEKYIEPIWKKRFPSIGLERDTFIQIMQKFDLICPLKVSSVNDEQSREFFVPCMLPKFDKKNVSKEPVVCKPIYYTFRFLPNGLFHRLIAKLCFEKIREWPLCDPTFRFLPNGLFHRLIPELCFEKIREWPLCEPNLFFDYARFKAGKFHFFTVWKKDNYIKLNIHMFDKKIKDMSAYPVCIDIREKIEATLDSIIHMYCPSVVYEVAVKCEFEENCLMAVSEKDVVENNGKLCDKHGNFNDLEPYRPWFSNRPPHSFRLLAGIVVVISIFLAVWTQGRVGLLAGIVVIISIFLAVWTQGRVGLTGIVSPSKFGEGTSHMKSRMYGIVNSVDVKQNIQQYLTHDTLDDVLLNIIGEKIGEDFQTLAINLGLRDEIDNIKASDPHVARNWGFQLLKLWQQRTEVLHQKEALAKTLRDIKRVDLAREVEAYTPP